MSYFACPDCGKKHSVFGESHLDEIAESYGIPVIGRVPIDVKLASACDKGMIELFEGNYMDDAIKAIDEI